MSVFRSSSLSLALSTSVLVFAPDARCEDAVDEPLPLALPEDNAGAAEQDASAPIPQRHIGEGLFSGWKTVHLAEGAFAGLQPYAWRVHEAGREGTPIATQLGLVFKLHSQIYMRSWYPRDDKSVRARLDVALGADSSGFAGEIRHEAAAGFRGSFGGYEPPPRVVTDGPLTPHLDEEMNDSLRRVFTRTPHAIIGRMGYHVSAAGNQDVYRSNLRPQLEIGYAYDGDSASVEARSEAGWLLLGRRNLLQYDRSLDMSPAIGGNFVLHVTDWIEDAWEPIDPANPDKLRNKIVDPGFHAELSFTRILDDDLPVDELSALACFHTSAPVFDAACASLDVTAGQVSERDLAPDWVTTRFALWASFGWMDP